MTHVADLSDQLVRSTIRIECDYADGTRGTGTGFFFAGLLGEGGNLPLLITNKHVIGGSTSGTLRFRVESRGVGRFSSEPMYFEGFEEMWIPHPDPAVDLAVMPTHPLNRILREQGFVTQEKYIPETSIATEQELADLGSLEDVLMIGYPNGLWDSVNDQPIVRRGITATHPELDYEGRTEFLIDAACFPGSSGSPVFLYNPWVTSTRSSGTILGQGRVKLLGVLYAGPVQTTEGEIRVVEIPTVSRAVAFSRIPINLGLVIKAARILDFYPILLDEIARRG